MILLRVFQRHRRQRILKAWVEDYKEVRRAKRWFNREREGEGEEGEGERVWYWPEGEDYISSLPREVAVKVSRTEEEREGGGNAVHFCLMCGCFAKSCTCVLECIGAIISWEC